jgi:hypothetical protein
MVKQRFLTHFKPWLIAVSKAGALIVFYQLFDQIRTRLEHPPLGISDVLMAATIALFALALVCGLWAWAEWCSFKLRRLRGFSSEFKLAFANHRNPRIFRTSKP